MRSTLAIVAALAPLACDAGAPTDAERLRSDVLDLVLDPEQAADPPVPGGMGTASTELQVAWSGTRYLAVWRQAGPTSVAGVYFTRIAADGTLLDKPSVRLASARTPSVAFFGGFLVVLRGFSGNVDLWRVGQQGTTARIGPVGVPGNQGMFPDIAAGTSEAMIVYNQEDSSGGRIVAARYDGLATSPLVQLGTGADVDAGPHIAYRPGGDYLAVWQNAIGDVRGRFVTPAGERGPAVDVTSSADIDGPPAVAFAGASFVVAWRALVTGGVQIRATLVSPTGQVSPPVDVSSVMSFADAPSVSCDTACTVLWSGGSDPATAQLWGRRLDGDLGPLGDEAVVVGGGAAQGPGELAGSGSAQYLVWLDGRSGEVDALGSTASIDGSGLTLGAPTLLPLGDITQVSAAVAASSTEWLVAWHDTRNGGYDFFGRRFDFDGVPKTPRAQPIHERPWNQYSVAVAGGESQFLAAWFHYGPQGEREVRATRVTAGGAPLDPAGITVGIAGLGGGPDVAAGADGSYLVAWTRDTGLVDRIHAAVVRPDGTVNAPLDLTSNVASVSSVGYDPGEDVYLVIWTEASGLDRFVRAVRVAADGSAVLDPAPVTLVTSQRYFPAPDMAFGAGLFFIAFTADQRVLGLRVALGPGGIEVLDPAPFPLDPAPGVQTAPSVTFTAKGFLVAYERFELGGTFDIHGVQVSPDGTVQGSAFVLADGPYQERVPAFAGASQRRALLAFQRYADDHYTVFVRRLVIGFPDGATCTADAQCESGSCMGGFCCGPTSCP